MATRLPIVLVSLAALAIGCGKQDTPRATKPQQSEQPVVTEATRAAEKQARAMQEEWQQLAKDVDRTVHNAQGKVTKQVKQVRKQSNDLAEYAAEMAEDAKDRALDIPDVIDEFFGDSDSSRGNWKRGGARR